MTCLVKNIFHFLSNALQKSNKHKFLMLKLFREEDGELSRQADIKNPNQTKVRKIKFSLNAKYTSRGFVHFSIHLTYHFITKS